MAVLEIAKDQVVTIPAIHLTNGKPFIGVIRASDGESLMIDVHERAGGSLPSHVDEMCILTWQSDGAQRSCPIIVRSNSPRSLVAQVVIQERREAPRVRIDMQLTYERVAPAKVKAMAEEVMARMNTLAAPPSESLQMLRREDDKLGQLQKDVAQLRDMLNDVLGRLDALAGLVAGQQIPQGSPGRPVVIMNVSSTGVGFICDEPLRSGDYLHLSMTLLSTPRSVIDCLGAVVRCLPVKEGEGQGAPRFDIGVRFTHIHETDRERLIQCLFKVQRRMLRDLKEARMALADQG